MNSLFGAALPLLLITPASGPVAQHSKPQARVAAEAKPHLIAYQTKAVPKIDGILDDACWQSAESTSPFVDIHGRTSPKPRHKTRVKVLWDAKHLYIAAELEEPHISGQVMKRDGVVYQDNAFELFIDPDGDTHNYYELQVNSLGTIWDLILNRPYRDGGTQFNGFNSPGMRCEVHLNGTLNDPTDVDRGWSVEIAIPFAALLEATGLPSAPKDKDVWWVNFSRVQWLFDPKVHGRGYTKRLPEDGCPMLGDFWTWSPTGALEMHKPETWGLVMFVEEVKSAKAPRKFIPPADLLQRVWLRNIYNAQKIRKGAGDEFTSLALELLGASIQDCKAAGYQLSIELIKAGYQATITWTVGESSRVLRIDQTGRLW